MGDAIERRSRYLRDFAHAVSHEFKTPLAGIRGAIELIQEHGDTMSEADRDRFLANASADADRLALFVGRLLELARADMAEAQADGSADLLLVLRRLVDAETGAGFTIKLDLAEELPRVATPAEVVEAAVANLVQNSRQAGATRVSISAASEADRIRLIVADDGPGIPPGDRLRIFEPFFTSQRAAGGTGLGLPITQSLLTAHGGSIGLEEGASGAVFLIRLPIANPLHA